MMNPSLFDEKAEQTCVISCIFGSDFNKVYEAPDCYKSFFFSNSRKLKDEVEKKGWVFVYVNFPIFNELAKSSFQSKFVKYLQFRGQLEFSWVKKFKYIIYIDHKFFLQKSHIGALFLEMKKSILLRKTPKLKNTVWDEVDAAMGQERYRQYMPQTKEYIERKLTQGYSDVVRISNTGMIVYDTSDPVVEQIVDEVYQDLICIGTSECQIVWALVTQKYKNKVQQMDWDKLPIIWRLPEED